MPTTRYTFTRCWINTGTGDVTGGFIEKSRLADASHTPPSNQTVSVVTTLLVTCDRTLFTRGGIIPPTVTDAVIGGPTCAMAITGDAGTVAAQVERIAVYR